LSVANWIWAIFSYGWWVSELAIAIATRTRSGGGSVRDRGTMPLLWVTIFCSIWASLWYRGTHAADIPGNPEWFQAISLTMLVFGVIFRWAAVISLGSAFSVNVAIREGQRVMQTGFYRWMRHPSYTAMLICFLAVGLHTRNWVSLAVVVVFPTAALMYRIYVEEIALREHFGAEYIDYSARTKRLIPGVY